MRTVKVINIRTSEPTTLETNASNFGELKEQLLQIDSFEGFNFKNSRCIVRDRSISDPNLSKKTISLDHELLPARDFTLYVSALKVSQGRDNFFVSVSDVAEFIDNLREVVSFLQEIEGLVDDEDEVKISVETSDEDEDDDYTSNLTEEEINDIEDLFN